MITGSYNEPTEQELFEEYIEIKETRGPKDQATVQARNTIFFNYRTLAVNKAKRYVKYCMPYRSLIDPSDIRNEADLGLLQAIDTYSLASGASFNTHAYTRINGSIIDGIRSLQEFPRIIARIRRELNPIIIGLSNKLGRRVTLDEIAIEYPFLTIGEKTITEIAKDNLVVSNVFNQQYTPKGSSGQPSEDDGEVECDSVESQLSIKKAKPVLDRMELSDTIDMVLEVLNDDDLERKVIYCYFFLGMTSTKISKTMRISPTWVSDKKASGLQKLRKKARSDHDFADELRRLSFR